MSSELLIGKNALPTGHARNMCAEEDMLPWSDIERLLHEFEQAAMTNNPPGCVNCCSKR